MFKLKIHFSFWVYSAFMLLQGRFLYLINMLVSAVIHEAGHARVAYNRGYVLKRLTLTPFGAVISGGSNIAKEDSFFIAIAGPLCNIIIASFITALWWLVPSSYAYTQTFCRVNIVLALFNLLPAYPLDGARILTSLSKKPLRAVKTLKVLGISFSLLFLAGFILSVFIKINYSLGIVALMLFVSALHQSKEDTYSHMARNASVVKDTSHPLSLKTVIVNQVLPLVELIKQIKNNQITEFIVVDEKLQKIAKLNEKEVGDICLKHSLRTKIGETLKKINAP
ncbi:MAG: hypothetical protein FWD49_04970 [Firmicutes bacterium]|nr:hypothetical protein [Bacillota bacterium]